jgi:fucose permease
MMMKWFDAKRGFAMGFSNVFVALLFSLAPVLFEYLIQNYGWRAAWQFTALVLLFVFPFIIFIFFRNDPTDVGLQPDGEAINKEKRKIYFPLKQHFTLKKARQTWAFWVVAGLLAMQGLWITGFTFHVVSIFGEAGMDRATAVSIFQPTAIGAVILTFIFSWIADKTKIKYLAYVMSLGGILGCIGVMFLEHRIGFYLLIFGHAIMTSLHSVLSSVAMPRFFGKLHLGAIVGQTMTIIVFGSAIGPFLMSSSLSYTSSYDIGALICMLCFLCLGLSAYRITNPQEQL